MNFLHQLKTAAANLHSDLERSGKVKVSITATDSSSWLEPNQ